MFGRVLIANRGEIALRVTRTLRRLGIEVVAVYSDADAGAPHVRAADRAVRIGPTAPARSYLDPERIVAAALRTGAEAVHPGYGFLSESPTLVRACEDAGLAFVGPGAEAMALLGDKVAAKEAARAAGVPILPGLSGAQLSDAEIEAWAAGAELPLLLKAAAGGGGKGMRVVGDLDELAEAIGAARREARGAFGDDRLLVERYLRDSRHIELQVIADAHGNVLHLGERECSLQRRHQKVIEEAPSPVVGPDLRERMGAAAVTLARDCGYVNAGTVELIAARDDPGAWFFLEVNTRLQVEHPVTEAVTGLDLVELQLRVAAGEPLPLHQEDVRLEGHAIEARLYAEDPARGFLPSSGEVLLYSEPRHPDVRVDAGIDAGSVVGTDYDPMLAKVIAHGDDRDRALSLLAGALEKTEVLGPATNVPYLRALLERREVREGTIDTGLIERLGDEVAPPTPGPELPAIALATLIGPPPGDDPWDARDGWRQTGPAWLRGRVQGPDGAVEVAIRARERDWEWKTESSGGGFAIEGGWLESDGLSRSLEVHQVEDGAVWIVDGAAAPARFELVRDEIAGAAESATGSLEAPMPGVVIEVRAAPDAAVAAGDVLVVLESMKMELQVQSPRNGAVAEVLVATGDRVDRGQLLVALKAPGSPPAMPGAAGDGSGGGTVEPAA